jgi:Kdo2-lipid IVA lauroyltransferase/acyltransferase
MRRRLEFVLVWAAVKLLSLPPRSIARRMGAFIGRLALLLTPRLAGVGDLNLRLAFPEKSTVERQQILRQLYRNLGWLLAEFCQMPRYTPETTRSFIRYEGLEHYLAARDEGKGVLLDNPLVDSLVNHIRCLHGNQVLHKDDFARGLLASMRRGETVGILMDTNMTPPQGSFVDFFGQPACTGSGLARIAMKTGARVLPGFLLWQEATQQYVLRFGAPVYVATSGDVEADVLANTALFTKVIEDYIRQYPDQWLWVHRRWKTRPQGEAPIYT